MTTRAYAKCNVCSFNMLLRIGEGSEPYQPHIFDCPSCGTPLTVALTREEQGCDFKTIDNCSLPSIKEMNELDGKSYVLDKQNINLHSSFAFNKADKHNPFGVGMLTTYSVFGIHELVKLRWPSLINKKENSTITPRIIDIALIFDVPECEKIFKTILKPLFGKNPKVPIKKYQKNLSIVI